MKSCWRFLILGLLTTGTTYAVYLAALLITNPMSAYMLALLCGLLIQVALLAPFVFSRRLDWRAGSRTMLIYVGYSFAYAGLMKVALWVGVPPLVAPLVVVSVAAPIQYLAGRRWLRQVPSDTAETANRML